MEEIRQRLEEARPRNWESWPALRKQWPWFVALGAIILLAIPWGIRAEERSLESASREALTDAGYRIEEITFTGRQATIVSNLSTNEQNGAVNALAAMGGVAKVTWVEGSGNIVSPTTPPVASTTTTPPEPGAVLTMTVRAGRLALRGTVPAAGTIRALADASEDFWGDNVGNQIGVDGSVVAHSWLGDAPGTVPILTMLIDAHLTLDADGATLTGGAVDEAAADAAVARLAEALGPDVAIKNNVVVSPLELPHFQIISPGDSTVSIEGTVANADVRKPIALAVVRGGEELEVTGKLQLSEGTADTYMLWRVPEIVTVLSSGEQWTLRSDGTGIGGNMSGGKAFTGNKLKPTAQVAELATVLVAFLEADPNLNISIEVHAEEREGSVDPDELAQGRAEAIGAHLVRLGIDPSRVSAGAAAGEGELLRFQLTPADQ
ncbi:MAG: hypothetical protein GY720_03665 [bacterium]|nr:hypothetical protein [bacterium]